MPTLVCFHAQPDDEAISTGGLVRPFELNFTDDELETVADLCSRF